MNCGIYKIINKINGKYYVGSTNNFNGRCGRKFRHTYELNKGIHKNQHLQNAWNKYGSINFDFLFIESVQEVDLLIVEQTYLNIAKTNIDQCYNKKFIAGGGVYGEVSESTRRKQSRGRIGELNPRYNSRIYTFKHIKSNDIFKGTKYEFTSMTGACRKDVNKLLLWGKADSVKGWIPLDKDVNDLRKMNKQPRKRGYVFTELHRKNLRLNWKSNKTIFSSVHDTCKDTFACTI